MNFAKSKILIFTIFIIFVFVIIYISPNNVLRIIAPKRYVFLCTTKTLKEVYLENSNKTFSPSALKLSMSKNNEQLLDFNVLNSNDNFIFSCDRFFGDNYKGFNKNSNIIQKYLSFKRIYENSVNVRRSNSKSFEVVESQDSLSSANGYEITFKKNFTENLIKRIDKAIDDKTVDEFLENCLSHIGSDVVINAYTNNKHQIISITARFKYDENDIFAEIVLKNQKALLNNIFFTCNIESENNITININSNGNHTGLNHQFTDETNIELLSHFVKAAQIDARTSADLNQQNNNISFDLHAKVLQHPIDISAIGNLNTESSDIFEANLIFKTDKNDDISLYINFNQNNQITQSSESFEGVSSITEKENDSIHNWINDFIKDNIISLSVAKGWGF